MKKIYLISINIFIIVFVSLLSLFGLVFLADPVKAQNAEGVEIYPAIIDEQAQARDMFKYDIAIKNNGQQKANLYPLVNDVLPTEGQQEFLGPGQLDKQVSLAAWISISRGVIELMPGEETTVPLEIDVNAAAKPGKYYAAITFVDAPNKPLAQERMKTINFPQVLINYEVGELIVEKAQSENFRSAKDVYLRPPVEFSVNVLNSGNRPIIPSGSVFIFNRRGVEVAALTVNGEGKEVLPGENAALAVVWPEGGGFGKFKARLDLKYGAQNTRDLQDTLFFWILPLPLLLLGGVVFIIGSFLLALALFRKTYRGHRAHGGARLVTDGIVDLRGAKK